MASPETNTAWVIDGYSLLTHPDLCARVREVNTLAGDPATFRYLYGRPTLVTENEVIVAFGAGTHIFCVRVPASTVDERLVGARGPALGVEWARVDPWTVELPKEEGLQELAALVKRAVENATGGHPGRPAGEG